MPIKKKRISPRQKMINLMYLVLLAMLALNVSSDVLNGFSLVADGLKKSTENASKSNMGIYSTFDQQMKDNPAKVKEWYEKAQYVRGMSDSLYNLAEELKEAIVRKSDGKEADVNNIKNREDLEASTQVMLAPGTGRGKELYNAINNYRERIVKMGQGEEGHHHQQPRHRRAHKGKDPWQELAGVRLREYAHGSRRDVAHQVAERRPLC